MNTFKYTSIIIVCLLAFLPGKLSAQLENSGNVRIAEQSVRKAGDSLHVNLKLDLTDLTVKSNLAVDIIPVLNGESGNTVLLPKLLVTGRDRHILYQRLPKKGKEGQREVRRCNKKEQQVKYTASLPYEKWMGHSSLAVVLDLCGCGWDKMDSSKMDIVDILINEPADYVPVLAYKIPAKEVKVRHKEGSAYLDFPVNKIVIYPDYRNNPRELAKIQATIDSVQNDPYATITDVSVRGYASPEGKYKHNAYLAEHRTKALMQYVRSLYHFQNATFSDSFEPEDWKGLEKRVEESSMEHRDEILAVIRDTNITDPDVRDRKLKSLHGGVPYSYLLNAIYPALRHSDYVVTYTIRPFSTEEAKSFLYTEPMKLSLEEMYRIAKTYERGSKEFNDVFDIAVRMYPNDEVANLNAANAALMRRDTEAARKYLAKVSPCGEKLLAEGALALYEGNKAAAVKRFEEAKAAGLGAEADTNLEFIQYISE